MMDYNITFSSQSTDAEFKTAAERLRGEIDEVCKQLWRISMDEKRLTWRGRPSWKRYTSYWRLLQRKRKLLKQRAELAEYAALAAFQASYRWGYLPA